MEKYYTLIETCVNAEDKNTAIEKTENVLRGKPQGVEYEASAVLNADTAHKAYLQYLSRWIFDHYEDEFKGCSPACFDEWLDNEDKEYEGDEEDDDENVSEDEDIDYESVADLVLDEGDYERDDRLGEIRIDKQVFDDFVKHSYIKIQFINDNGDDNVYTYIMESEDDEFITCEFIG